MTIIIQLPNDINRFCRTCMAVAEDKNSFENYIIQNGKLTELHEVVQSVTSLKIAVEDGLPETICSPCFEKLTFSYKYVTQSKETDVKLRNLLAISKKGETNKSDHSLAESSQVELHDDSSYTCDDCFDVFTSYYSLSLHMVTHNSTKTLYERFVENRTADSKDSLMEIDCKNDTLGLADEHKLIDSDTDSKKPITEDVNKQNSNFNKQTEPKKSTILGKESSNLFTTCSLCNRTFPDASKLSLHFLQHALSTKGMMETCAEAEFFFCGICGETFNTKPLLDDHYNEKHEKPSWTCEKCSYTFDYEHDFLLHDDVHALEDEDKEYACVLCSSTFKPKSALQKHSIEHLMKKYNCKKCPLSFSTHQSYFAHVQLHSSYQYPCKMCGKFLSTKSALKSHTIGVHSDELHHICTTCGKGFATSSRLKIHSDIHNNHKKYVCSYCGYSTHKAGDLKMHTRIHTSERPYKCTFAKCEASFKTSSHLCEHVRRHLQIRRFKCSICSISFSTNNGLKIHQMQHTGEKPHSCLICHQKFRRKYHVKVHMKQHEPKC